ncbi:discoidin domain-containing protein [Streptacidiphilus melanogenes]|uniref:discoidin domain-containing protein n=1 Tax=Streptacidiphilus melanogenes TaxID=411235 RepID=UPI0005AADAAE|nr:discoidin domain-containing protein [Streptacidiphilus melanogenes]
MSLTRRQFVLAAAGLGAVVANGPGAVPAARAATAASAPLCIPALQQWTSAAGSYSFGAGSRIVTDAAYVGQLAGEAALFAADLGLLTGRSIASATGSAASVGTGDIFLTLGSTDAGLGTEGYTLAVGASVTVQARAAAGVFYGTRTLLQLLRQSASIPAGTARDEPDSVERGLMVDVGRKYFSVAWLQNQIKDMAYAKLNYLHLHFSDNLGFRLESSSHPEIVSAQYYTKQQITDLIGLAAAHHITIVPEIDMPGHMDTILTAHPELKLKAADGSTPDGSNIDLSNPAAYQLMKDLITEYLPLFPAPYWHLGADEYGADYNSFPQLQAYARQQYGAGATAKDVYYGFVRWADAIVRAGGKTMRMWNDGIKSGDGTIPVAADITVDYWYDYGLTPQQLMDAGHPVNNSSWTPTYYVLGGAVPDTTFMYEQWNPGIFQGNATVTDPARVLGSKIHVWCDNPTAQTEQQVAGGIFAPLRTLAQQTWGSPHPVTTFGDYQTVIATMGRVPGWPVDVPAGDLALNRPTTASSVETAAFPALYATDGSYGTRWSSLYSDPQWLQVDLGAPYRVTGAKLSWETAYAKAYQVQVSDDAANWTTIYATTNGPGGTEQIGGLDGAGRYVRVLGTQRATSWGYSLWEFEVHGTPDLALGQPATASSVESGLSWLAPSFAVDGSSGTRWSSDYADPQWLQVDLGVERTVNEVRLLWEAAYAKAYQIQVSGDAVTWTTIYSTTNGPGGAERLTGLNGAGRYIRVLGTQRATNWGYSLWEFQVYGS